MAQPASSPPAPTTHRGIRSPAAPLQAVLPPPDPILDTRVPPDRVLLTIHAVQSPEGNLPIEYLRSKRVEIIGEIQLWRNGTISQ